MVFLLLYSCVTAALNHLLDAKSHGYGQTPTLGSGIKSGRNILSKNFKETDLWKRTLEARAAGTDSHSQDRDKLRAAYLSMRERAAPLVALGHIECQGLTVHDVTHLDALWEMADLIVGSDFEVNPVEAFAFGAAVLVHDAGMAVAAYEGGLQAIKATTTWKDTVAGLLRSDGVAITPETLENPPANLLQAAIFSTLRSLHAAQAEELVTRKWNVPGSGDPVYLLDDRDLRDFYGKRIGRIAHSHHWSIEEVGAQMMDQVGALASFPSEWVLNEVKVASMLRCADAAHIDQLRAPTMLFALQQPVGVSLSHWGFQNKLSRPTLFSGELVYSSGQDFGRSEVAQWWLCYDTAKMIDSELRTSNALLNERGVTSFAARGVRGVATAKLFSRDVIPAGWEPVDAEVKVSDPIHLARTLGGRNLYGYNELATIRELIQNGMDAVRALRLQRQADTSFGFVRISLEKKPDQDGESIWLHVDDNGIGMSERVLTGPLIDFGKSIWSSPMLKEEYPGVNAAGMRPIGKFGIGFFSVFLLGNEVRVVSKKSDAGTADIRVLEFDRLSRRPILRRAMTGELPSDVSTRVSIKLENPAFVAPKPEPDERRPRSHDAEWTDLAPQLKRLVCAADVRVSFVDAMADRSFEHLPNWESSAPDVFLSELLATNRQSWRDKIISRYGPSLSSVRGENGESVGRAALDYSFESSPEPGKAYVAVGGLVQLSQYSYVPSSFYVGVMNGETEDASRKGAQISVEKATIAKWATDQGSRIDRSRFMDTQLLPIAQSIYRSGGDPGGLPICFLSGRFATLAELADFLKKNRAIHLRVKPDYAQHLNWESFSDIQASDLTSPLKPGVLIFMHSDLFSTSAILDSDRNPGNQFDSAPREISIDEHGFRSFNMKPFFDIIRREWGSFSATLEGMQQFSGVLLAPPSPRWVITLKRVDSIP
jgi:hypothetical protein